MTDDIDFAKKHDVAMKVISEMLDDDGWAKFFAMYCERLGLYDE